MPTRLNRRLEERTAAAAWPRSKSTSALSAGSGANRRGEKTMRALPRTLIAAIGGLAVLAIAASAAVAHGSGGAMKCLEQAAKQALSE
jgi:hypothetical protein